MSRFFNPFSKKAPFDKEEKPVYRYKTRFSLIGTVGSGKSVIATLLFLTAQTLSQMIDGFYCRVLEGDSNIRSDVSNMRRGIFPKKTDPMKPYAPEAGLLINWPTKFGDKKCQIPIADVAGEVLLQIMRKSKTSKEYSFNDKVVDYVKNSDGILIAAPASRVFLDWDIPIEEETYKDPTYQNEPDRIEDPDVPLSRIVSDLITYKESKHQKFKGIGVILTKWDKIMPYVKRLEIDMDAFEPSGEGLKKFMDNCFSQTMTELKASGVPVEFFPSYLTLQKDNEGHTLRWNDKTEKINLLSIENDKRRVPEYPEKVYMKIFEWLRSYA